MSIHKIENYRSACNKLLFLLLCNRLNRPFVWINRLIKYLSKITRCFHVRQSQAMSHANKKNNNRRANKIFINVIFFGHFFVRISYSPISSFFLVHKLYWACASVFVREHITTEIPFACVEFTMVFLFFFLFLFLFICYFILVIESRPKGLAQSHRNTFSDCVFRFD